MTVDDVLAYFGTQTAVAAELEISQPAIAHWRRRGEIPLLRQYQIEAVTAGALRVDARARAVARLRSGASPDARKRQRRLDGERRSQVDPT